MQSATSSKIADDPDPANNDIYNVRTMNIIRFFFLPALTATGGKAGVHYIRCVESVPFMSEENFITETKNVLSHFHTWEDFPFLAALHNRAKRTSLNYHIIDTFSNDAFTHAVIKGILTQASTEQIVRSGRFVSDTIGATANAARIMRNVLDDMVDIWIRFEERSHTHHTPPPQIHDSHIPHTGGARTASIANSRISARIDRRIAPTPITYDDITPDDSVSVANAPSTTGTVTFDQLLIEGRKQLQMQKQLNLQR